MARVTEWLETERLILRRHVKADAPAIADLVDNWNVVRWLSRVPHPYTLADAESWIQQTESAWMAGRDYQFVVERRDDAVLIGHIGLTVERRDLSGELGYWVGEPYWGHGYATEAAEAIIAFGFERLSLRNIHARVMPDNIRSVAILENLGLTPAGQVEQHHLALDRTLLVPVVAIDRETWRAPRVLR